MRQTVFSLIIALSASLYAGDRSEFYLGLDFSVDRQTYNWSDSASGRYDFSSRLQGHFHNRSQATLFQETVFGRGGDRWQKTALTRGSLDYRLSGSWRSGLSFVQEFDRLEERRFIGNRAYVTVAFERSRFKLTQRGGLLWEERKIEPETNRSTGLAYEAELSFSPQPKLGFGRITGEATTLKRTPKRSVWISYELPQLVWRQDTLSISSTQSLAVRKYFPSAGNFDATARQSTRQHRWDVAVVKALPLATSAVFETAYRYDRYDYEYENLAAGALRQNDNLSSIFEYQLTLARRWGRVYTESQYLYNRTREDYGAALTNQKAETGQLLARASASFGDRDSIEVSGQIGVTSYFAPAGSAIFADRDRKLRVATLRVAHRFSEFLTGSLESSVRSFETIYISGALSANNNFNNIYIISPGLRWRPANAVVIQHSYQMHANYTYYTYEKNAVSERNTIYRRAQFTNTITVAVSPRLELLGEYSYRYEDFGRLLWDGEWKQQVSWDRRTHRPRLGLTYRPFAALRFAPFASYEWQGFFNHLFDATSQLGRREQSERLTRAALGFEFAWTLSPNSYLDCRLERRVQDYLNQRRQEYDVFTLSLKRTL